MGWGVILSQPDQNKSKFERFIFFDFFAVDPYKNVWYFLGWICFQIIWCKLLAGCRGKEKFFQTTFFWLLVFLCVIVTFPESIANYPHQIHLCRGWVVSNGKCRGKCNIKSTKKNINSIQYIIQYIYYSLFQSKLGIKSVSSNP